MKVLPKILTAFMVSILLLSCVTKQENGAGYSVYVTNSQKYELLPPSAFEEDMDRFQNITGSFQGKVYIFGAYIKSDARAFFLKLHHAGHQGRFRRSRQRLGKRDREPSASLLYIVAVLAQEVLELCIAL